MSRITAYCVRCGHRQANVWDACNLCGCGALLKVTWRYWLKRAWWTLKNAAWLIVHTLREST